MYLALKASRGGESITYSDMGWYAEIHDIKILPWEADLMQSLDRIYHKVARDSEEKMRDGRPS